MDIRIGVRQSGREISFESAQSAAEVEAQVAACLESGAKVLKLTDAKGRKYIVPTDALVQAHRHHKAHHQQRTKQIAKEQGGV